MNANREDLIQELRRKIAELKSRFPAHSIPPALMAELDDLEEQLAQAQKDQLGLENPGE